MHSCLIDYGFPYLTVGYVTDQAKADAVTLSNKLDVLSFPIDRDSENYKTFFLKFYLFHPLWRGRRHPLCCVPNFNK